MTRLLTFILFGALSTQTLAAPATGTQTDDKLGLAVIVLDQNADNFSRSKPVFHRIIARLQRGIRQADLRVFNAVLPTKKQPDWKLGLDAVSQSVSTINNPHIDSIVVVTASADIGQANQVALNLTLQMFDVETQTVYREISETRQFEMKEACKESCTKEVDNQLVRLSQLMMPDVLASLQDEYDADIVNYQVANR